MGSQTNKTLLITALLLLGGVVAAFGSGISNFFMGGLQIAFDLIKRLEGRDGLQTDGTYKAVGDVTGIPTIGYGSTVYPDGSRVQLGDTATETDVIRYMQDEATKYYNTINQQSRVKLTANQAAALTSFAYNIGINGLLGSTLWQLLQSGTPAGTVANEFDKWVYAGGRVVPGLANRRAIEKQVFLS